MDNKLKGRLCFKGERGYSTYELAVKNGFVGTEKEWFAQLVTNNTTTKHHNAVSNMKLDKALIAGSQVQTFGYYEANDGGAATYLIREKTDSDVEDNATIHFLNNGLVAELIIGDSVTAKQFGAYNDGINDDAVAINKAIEAGKNIMLENKTYYLFTPIVIDRPVNIEGLGIAKTIIEAKDGINVIDIKPSLKNIEGNGFDIGGFSIKGNDVAKVGVHYDNEASTKNYIARWLIHDIKIEGCEEAIKFINQEVADGYFIGGFEHIYCGCPLNFYRAGDSWFIKDSQFYNNGKVTIHSIATGARCFAFENNNYTAQGFVFNGNGLIFEKNQMEPSTLPAVKIKGYNCCIKNSAINSHGTETDSYMIEFDNGLGVDNQGAINSIEGGILVCPANSNNIVKANDKVTISNTGFYEHTGPIINDKGSYVSGLLVDYNREWSFKAENGGEIQEQHTEYKDGYLYVSVKSQINLTDTYDGTVLLSIDKGHNLESNQYVPFFGEYTPNSVLTRSPSWARISTPKTINTSAPYSQAQTLTHFVVTGQIKCEI